MQSEPIYRDGGSFWQDILTTYGKPEAIKICTRYLKMQMKCDVSEEERQFCQELHRAMRGD
jgi:hypothetical protein